MLAGILNSALLVVIILDVVGAAVYFGLTCLKRFKAEKAESSGMLRTFPSFANGFGGGMVPVPAGASAMAVYGASEPQAVLESDAGRPDDRERRGLVSDIRTRIESFGGTFARRSQAAPATDGVSQISDPGQASDRNQTSGDDQVQNRVTKLNRILDSFKEDI